MLSPKHIALLESLIEHDLDFDAAIQLLEETIETESLNKEANRLIGNQVNYLGHDYRITHAKILLSLLRFQNGLRRG